MVANGDKSDWDVTTVASPHFGNSWLTKSTFAGRPVSLQKSKNINSGFRTKMLL